MTATIHHLDAPKPDTDRPRKPFSFEIVQTEAHGMVLIDACVPQSLALTFLQMLIACQEAANNS